MSDKKTKKLTTTPKKTKKNEVLNDLSFGTINTGKSYVEPKPEEPDAHVVNEHIKVGEISFDTSNSPAKPKAIKKPIPTPKKQEKLTKEQRAERKSQEIRNELAFGTFNSGKSYVERNEEQEEQEEINSLHKHIKVGEISFDQPKKLDKKQTPPPLIKKQTKKQKVSKMIGKTKNDVTFGAKTSGKSYVTKPTVLKEGGTLHQSKKPAIKSTVQSDSNWYKNKSLNKEQGIYSKESSRIIREITRKRPGPAIKLKGKEKKEYELNKNSSTNHSSVFDGIPIPTTKPKMGSGVSNFVETNVSRPTQLSSPQKKQKSKFKNNNQSNLLNDIIDDGNSFTKSTPLKRSKKSK